MSDQTPDTPSFLLPEDSLPEIPDKLYFKIGEVCGLTRVAAHVLRFWESEFPQIAPRRTESGQRLYTRADIEKILQIKHLLYDKKYTLKGARRHLKRRARSPDTKRLLQEIATELQSIRDFLD